MKNTKLLGIIGLICIIAVIGLSVALICIPDKPTKEDPPVTPSDPVTPITPQEPVTPITPQEPTDPEQPADPTTPVLPADPENPVPEQPENPVNPGEAGEPVTPPPTPPATPSGESTEPTEPGNPVEPPETASILDDPLLVLCNIDNPLPDGFSVDDLTTAQGKYQLSEVAAEAVKKMIAGAKKDGIELIICSAYRTISRQKELFADKLSYYKKQGMSDDEAYAKTATIIAVPGTSEHHTGLAADIVTPSYQTLDEGYMNTDAAKWLKAHCSEYGFILRYPIDKKDITKIIFEPWHFRYVGEYAKEITESGLCLEEWVEKVKSENR